MTSVHRSYQTLTETLQRQKQGVRVPKVSFRNVLSFETRLRHPWDMFVLRLQRCTFVAPVLSKHKQLYARSCCRKIYQTLGLRFFMRHSSPPPFKEGYRYFGMVPRSGCSRQIRFWHIVPARPQVSHFVRELRAIGCQVASV